jgi:phosphonate transport system substrate-binding protein
MRLLVCLLLLTFIPATEAAEKGAAAPVRIGLTPVFLDDQSGFVSEWRIYLEERLKRPVSFIQRGSYREVVDMLREGKLDFAWLCGYPYVRNREYFRLVAVPLYKGEPLYQSYIIVPTSDKTTRSINDLRGKIFAFSDPDSNSGHLYPEYLLAKNDKTAATHFAKTFYTWSHRKVVEAVASGLAQGGAVDGYVWDTLVLSHPELTSKTRIIAESPQFGHPPFVASAAVPQKLFLAMQDALLLMVHDPKGSPLLIGLNLDGFVYGDPQQYDGIAEMYRFIERQRDVASQRH